MKKIIRLIAVTGILGVMSINTTFAFDRAMVVANARTVINQDWLIGNKITIVSNAGPTQTGSNNHSLPAYGQIAQTIAQIQILKQQMKNSSHN